MMLSLLADLDGFAVPGSESSELSESLACGSGNSVRNFSSSIPKEGGSHSSRPSRMQLVPSMGLMPGHVFENYPLGLEAAITEEFAIRDGGLWNVLEQISTSFRSCRMRLLKMMPPFVPLEPGPDSQKCHITGFEAWRVSNTLIRRSESMVMPFPGPPDIQSTEILR